jgi:hypothetical protein
VSINAGEFPFDEKGVDSYADQWRVIVTDYGDIELRVSERSFGDGENFKSHAYSIGEADRLRKTLKKAIKYAETVR